MHYRPRVTCLALLFMMLAMSFRMPAHAQNDTPSDIIRSVVIGKNEVCPGEDTWIVVRALNPQNFKEQVAISIDGKPGNVRRIQFEGAPGVRVISVSATAAGQTESKLVEITVQDCSDSEATVEPVLQAVVSPHDPLTVEFEVTNANELTQTGLDLSVLSWDFGDGNSTETAGLFAKHNYASSLDAESEQLSFEAKLTIPNATGDDIVTYQTVTIWNVYVINKQRGLIQPVVDTSIDGAVTAAHLSAPATAASFSVQNLEDEVITILSTTKEERFCDPTSVPTVSQIDNLIDTIDANQKAIGNATLPFELKSSEPLPLEELIDLGVIDIAAALELSDLTNPITGDPLIFQPTYTLPSIDLSTPTAQPICGVAYHITGQTESGEEVRFSVYYEADQNPEQLTAVADNGTINLLNDAIAKGLVTSVDRIGAAELYELERQNLISRTPNISIIIPSLPLIPVLPVSPVLPLDPFFPIDPIVPVNPIVPVVPVNPSIPDQGGVHAAAMMNIGEECQPGDTPPQEGMSCQATNEWREAPPYIANAKKGDIVMSAACGFIGSLLREVEPAQKYSHTGIMIEDYYRLRHSTAAQDRYADNADGDGFVPDILKFGWPGTISQSIKEAFQGGVYQDPATDKVYNVAGFNSHAVQCTLDEAIIYPLVVKPPVEHEASVRPTLHSAAEMAKTINGHYRFANYSDATIAMDPTKNAPASAGWAEGTRGNVCSSFIWSAFKELDITLEGDELEALDIALGAERISTAAATDGLYHYTAPERLAAANWLYSHMYDEVYDNNGGWAAVLFADAPDDIANQMTNCFASDSCETSDKDSEAWKSPGTGLAISPDNILWWDAPPVGVYGYSEPLLYRDGQYFRVYRWQPSDGYYSVTGTVTTDGAVEPNARITLAGEETFSAADGSYGFELIPGGDYDIVATKIIGGKEFSDNQFITLNGDVSNLALTLEDQQSIAPVPETHPEYYRRVTITGNMFLRDHETFGSDETGNFAIDQTLDLAPDSRTGTFTIENCVGAEVRSTVQFTLSLRDDNTTVDVQTSSRLYEGASCSTDDLEDSDSESYTAVRDSTLNRTINMDNNGDDEAIITYAITNAQIPIEEITEAQREITITGTMFLLDHESISSNETGTFPINRTVFLGPSNPTENVSVKHCVGDEVRGEITYSLSLRADNVTVDVSTASQLFEGTTCSTNDLEDTGAESYSLAQNATEIRRVELDNNGDDKADIHYTISNNARAGGGLPPATDSYREVIVSGSMHLVDHETLGSNETATFALFKGSFLNPANRTETFTIKNCVGGEVRGEITFTLQLRADNTTVDAQASARLFEGTACDTDELEDSETINVAALKDEENVRVINLVNNEDEDRANFNFTISNFRQP